MVVVGVLPLSMRVAVIVVSISVLLVLLYLAEVAVQSIEALFPVPAILVDPVGDLPERTRLQSARTPLGLPSLLDEARSFQHSEVLGDGGLAHVEGRPEVLHGRLAGGETSKDRPARRVGECGERGAERVSRHAHHLSVI